MSSISYFKMNGAGNEIVMLDLRDQPVFVTAEAARAIAASDLHKRHRIS
ncbi:unnamed protein product [Laminaria digitata]